MSAHRAAAALAGAALIAVFAVPGSGAASATASAFGTASAPQSVPAEATATSIAPVATLVPAGSVFRVDITYTCQPKYTASLSVQAHQNVGSGFVANGFGYMWAPLTCDGRKHTVRLTVGPASDRGFRRGQAYVIADFSGCSLSTEQCTSARAERILAVR